MQALSGGQDGGANAGRALSDRGVGQPDNFYLGQLRADPDLDLDGNAVDAVQGGSYNLRHGPVLRGTGGDALRFEGAHRAQGVESWETGLPGEKPCLQLLKSPARRRASPGKWSNLF